MTAHQKRTRHGVIRGDQADHERSYVALVNMRWGDGWLKPGDPVPNEPGRNYGSLLRQGKIALATPAPAQRTRGR
jgi:hypothetical protein